MTALGLSAPATADEETSTSRGSLPSRKKADAKVFVQPKAGQAICVFEKTVQIQLRL
jgi:hypothetical protein